MKKPISPGAHGTIDYVLGTAMMTVPQMIGMNTKAVNTYRVLSTGMTALNAFTDTPAGVKKMVSLKNHKQADTGLLAGMFALTFMNFIRKDKKALAFHLGLTGVALAHYLLTDYEA